MRKLFLQAKHQQNPVAVDLCVCRGGGDWGVAGFYVVGTPGLFWGANTWHCFGLTCEDLRCNQRNRVHLKLFKHIHFPPGETCLPWHSIPATGLPWCGFWFLWLPLQLPAVFVLPLWFPLGDALKQLLGSDSAVVFLSYSPQRTTRGEAISPALVGRKRTLLTLFLPAQNAFLVSCVLRFTPVCLHILSTLTAGNSGDPVTRALHLPALSLAVFNPGSPQ